MRHQCWTDSATSIAGDTSSSQRCRVQVNAAVFQDFEAGHHQPATGLRRETLHKHESAACALLLVSDPRAEMSLRSVRAKARRSAPAIAELAGLKGRAYELKIARAIID